MKLETRQRGPAVLPVYRALSRAYGPLPRVPRGDPLGTLVETILSQNTTDTNSHRAYLSLRRRFPTWRKVADARVRDIAAAIRQGGLANIKAGRIREVLRLIERREGRISLHRLKRMGNAEVLEYLGNMPGVGPKTAACVLLFSLGRAVMPVDTHVHRVTRRLGWIPERTPAEEAGPILERFVPPRLVFGTHIYLVWHGRRTCKAQRPLCPECVLRRSCGAWRKGRVGRGR